MISKEHLDELIGIQVQVYAWHIGTGSLAEHEAFGDLFTKIHDLVDSFLETGMGRERNRIRLPINAQAVGYVDFETCMKRLEKFVAFCEGELWQTIAGNRDAENVLADLIASVNGVKFLSSLN